MQNNRYSAGYHEPEKLREAILSLSQNSILFFMWLQISVLLADCCQYHELTPELCPKKMPVLYTHVSKS